MGDADHVASLQGVLATDVREIFGQAALIAQISNLFGCALAEDVH